MIKVIIADDIPILRQGLKAILSQDPELDIVGLASDGAQAFDLCQSLKPDVVLMDMRMPQYDGAYGARKIKESMPDIKVLVLTTFDDDETVQAALLSGADGYILKEMEDEKVIQSVKAVKNGISVFGNSIFQSLKKQMKPMISTPSEADFLTPREREIIRLVAGGLDNKEIAAQLFLAEGTVRNHLSKILDKLRLKDRTQLAVYAVKNNLD